MIKYTAQLFHEVYLSDKEVRSITSDKLISYFKKELNFDDFFIDGKHLYGHDDDRHGGSSEKIRVATELDKALVLILKLIDQEERDSWKTK